MGTVRTYPPGTFCWVDLGTPDAEGAVAFYGGLFGWTFSDVGSPEAPYVLCLAGEHVVAGLHVHPEGTAHGWTSYVSVEDAEAAQARAVELGGEAVGPVAELPETARVGVIRDPHGAELVAWQAAGFAGASLVNEPGAWTWNELTTPDVSAAADFYGGLFGWKVEGTPTEGRAAFALGELLAGGAHVPFGPFDPPGWTVTFWVDDADAAVERAAELGGSVVVPPMDVPVGRFAGLADPTGSAFTVAAVPGGPSRALGA